MLGKAFSQARLLVPRTVGKSSVRNAGHGHQHFQSSLPQEKVSKGEMLALKAFITVGISAFPAYVIFNMQEFKRQGGGDA